MRASAAAAICSLRFGCIMLLRAELYLAFAALLSAHAVVTPHATAKAEHMQDVVLSVRENG